MYGRDEDTRADDTQVTTAAYMAHRKGKVQGHGKDFPLVILQIVWRALRCDDRIRIAQLNQKWRALMHGDLCLWTRLHLDIPAEDKLCQATIDNLAAKVAFYEERLPEPCPLHLQILSVHAKSHIQTLLPRFTVALHAFFTGKHRFTSHLQALSISGTAKNAPDLVGVWLGNGASPSLQSLRVADGTQHAWTKVLRHHKWTLLDLIVAGPSDATFEESQWPLILNKAHNRPASDVRFMPLRRMSLSEVVVIKVSPTSDTTFAELKSLEITPSKHSLGRVSVFITHAPLTHLRRLSLVDTIFSASFTLCSTTQAAIRTGRAIAVLESKLLEACLHFPVLEELALACNRHHRYTPAHLAPLLLPSIYLCRFESPLLRRLSLSGYEALLGKEGSDLKPRERRAWLTFAERHSHIQELTLQSMGIPEMHKLPSLFPDLMKLSFTHVPISARFWEGINATALPHLTHCTFANCVGISEENLLNFIESRHGKLEYLDISDYRGHLREDTVSFLKAFTTEVKHGKRHRRQSGDDPWAWVEHER